MTFLLDVRYESPQKQKQMHFNSNKQKKAKREREGEKKSTEFPNTLVSP